MSTTIYFFGRCPGISFGCESQFNEQKALYDALSITYSTKSCKIYGSHDFICSTSMTVRSAVRFITDEAVFDPRPGQGAAFTKQIEIEPGEVLKSSAFPVLETS